MLTVFFPQSRRYVHLGDTHLTGRRKRAIDVEQYELLVWTVSECLGDHDGA